MRPALKITAVSLAAVGAGIAFAPSVIGQTAPGAPVRYEMDIGTATGLGFGPGGGGNVNPLALLRGQNNAPRKELLLRIGSPNAPSGGTANADHFLPATMRMGASVPLVTPQRAPDDDSDRIPQQRDGQRPQGRILIFWGCGAHAPANQPVIIDLARLTSAQSVPPGLFTSTVPRQREVSFSNSRTYGDWPNGRSRATVNTDSSLVGAHRVAGNYSPEIAFNLTQDFMGPLRATGADQADGSVILNWNAVPNATGFYAWTMGFNSNGRGQGGDMVWWSSSASQQFGGGLWDWLSPSAVATLVRNRTVMPATQTACQVPVEVKRAAPEFMFGNLYAYGPEANFAFPPRPANARTPWRPIWTARARYRSHTSWIVGGPPGLGDSGNGNDQQAANGDPNAPQPDPNRCRRRGGLGGVIGRVVRIPGC
jgi:hypothetical protein